MTKRHHKKQWTLTATAKLNHPSPEHWKSFAQRAEKAKLHSVILVDDVVEPSVYTASIGAVTESIGLTIAYNTKGEHPYLQARKFASLDHLTRGRLGWANTEELQYSEEYLEVFSELLLSSWRDDALVGNKETKEQINTDRLRQIDFVGETYTVPGPGLTHPTPQRLPLIVSLDTTTNASRHHAAKFAEVVSVYGDKEQVKETVKSIKLLALRKYHRDPSTIRFLAQVSITIADSTVAVQNKYALGFAPPSGFSPIRGTSKTVADELQHWVEYSGLDGFNFHESNINDLNDYLISELQARGVAQVEYTTIGGTLRENLTGAKGASFLSQDHPFYHYRWFKGQSQEAFEKALHIAKDKNSFIAY